MAEPADRMGQPDAGALDPARATAHGAAQDRGAAPAQAAATDAVPALAPAAARAGRFSQLQLPFRQLRRLQQSPHGRPLVALATIGAWALAVTSWIGLYRMTRQGKGLGWDLLTTWRAEKLFAHGGAPYDVKAFLYPPSCLLLLRPLGSLNEHDLRVGGLIATLVLGWLTVVVAAAVVGRHWWGLTAAITIWLLHFTQAMRGELSLENVTVISAAALAVSFLLVLRGYWATAGALVGLTLAIKPLLIVVLLVFVLYRRWKALAAAVAVPAVLNLVALVLVKNPVQVLTKLPSLLNRSGNGVNFNSAWVDVVRIFGMPVGVSWLARIVSVGLAAAGVWLAWTRIADERLRLVTVTSMLLIALFLAGSLSEYHFMLTLVPFAMAIVLSEAPMRAPICILGIIWTMGTLVVPASVLGINGQANYSAFRAFGMMLILFSTVTVLARRAPAPTRSATPALPPRLADRVTGAVEASETARA